MAPRYIPAHGKSVGLPNTWPSSPTHRGQNMVHAEADWIGRMEKEEKQAKKCDPAGAFADGAEIVIPQYQPDSPVRDKWGWGKSALVADGAILNPMTAYRTSTQCGRPASVVAAEEQRLREKTPRRSFAQTSLSEADLRRPSTTDSPGSRGEPRDLRARSWDTGHGMSWDNGMAAMSFFAMADLPSVRKAKERSKSRGSRRPSSVAGSRVSTAGFSADGGAPVTQKMLSSMKQRSDRLDGLLQQARESEGEFRGMVRDELRRQLRRDDLRRSGGTRSRLRSGSTRSGRASNASGNNRSMQMSSRQAGTAAMETMNRRRQVRALCLRLHLRLWLC